MSEARSDVRCIWRWTIVHAFGKTPKSAVGCQFFFFFSGCPRTEFHKKLFKSPGGLAVLKARLSFCSCRGCQRSCLSLRSGRAGAVLCFSRRSGDISLLHDQLEATHPRVYCTGAHDFGTAMQGYITAGVYHRSNVLIGITLSALVTRSIRFPTANAGLFSRSERARLCERGLSSVGCWGVCPCTLV